MSVIKHPHTFTRYIYICINCTHYDYSVLLLCCVCNPLFSNGYQTDKEDNELNCVLLQYSTRYMHTFWALLWSTLLLSSCFHDDVIKWKHFPRYWPFVRGIQRSPVDFLHKGRWRWDSNFSSAPEQTIEQTIKTPVIWEAIALITTSL